MMRKLTLALAAFPLLVLAAPESTQPPAEPPQAEADGALAPAPLEGGARAEEGGKAAVAPPDTYTIRPGDTLWDLSGRFLNNPWYWPKIWSYNPDIANPHWINPGDLLRFYAAAEDGAGEVVPVTPEEPLAEAEPEGESVRELEDLSRANLADQASDEEREVVSVAGAKPVGYVPPRTLFARHDSFVTRKELAESGTIKASFAEKAMLATHDTAYVAFKNTGNIKLGESYSIFRTLREVRHPITREPIGYQTIILGTGKVVGLDPKAATVAIVASYDAIERGDRLGPFLDKPYRAVPPKANAAQLRGFIVGSPIERVTELAESQIVFVDKGKRDGVEEGNSFVVLRSGDPTSAGLMATTIWDPSLPREDVGRLLVVDVKEHTSAALVTKSLRELIPGDRVEMRLAEK